MLSGTCNKPAKERRRESSRAVHESAWRWLAQRSVQAWEESDQWGWQQQTLTLTPTTTWQPGHSVNASHCFKIHFTAFTPSSSISHQLINNLKLITNYNTAPKTSNHLLARLYTPDLRSFNSRCLQTSTEGTCMRDWWWQYYQNYASWALCCWLTNNKQISIIQSQTVKAALKFHGMNYYVHRNIN